MRAQVFVRAQDHADRIGATLSGFVERVVAEALDAAGAPKIDRAEAVTRVLGRRQPANVGGERPPADPDEVEALRRKAFG